MTRIERNYDLASHAAGRRILLVLGQKFPARRQAPVRRETIYLDTFDWRLHSDGGFLSATGAGPGRWVASWTSDQGLVRRRLTLKAIPSFAGEFPAGPFRRAIEAVIEVRRLLPVAHSVQTVESLLLLDASVKPAVTVELVSATASRKEGAGKVVSVKPWLKLSVTGRATALQGEIMRFIEEELKLARAGSTEAATIMAAARVRPGGYTSKLSFSLRPWMRSDQAVKQIHQRLLRTMRANERGMRDSLDPEFLHDFRVAVRRTRTALAQIKQVFPRRVVDRARREFSWLGRATGPARDLDVYILQLGQYRGMITTGLRHELDPLTDFLRRMQQEEQAKLGQIVASRRYRELGRSWGEFLGRKVPLRSPLPNATRPIIEVASERISRRWHRVLQRGKKLGPSSPDAELHALRIDCKKLRYLLEFFRSLYQPSDVEELVGALKKLQDVLGEFNDLVVHRSTVRPYALQMAEREGIGAACLLSIGHLEARLAMRQQEVRDGFRKRFAKFSGKKSQDCMTRMMLRAGDTR